LSSRRRDDDVRAAVDPLVQALTARRVERLAGLVPADGDSTSARDFLTWASDARRLTVTSAAIVGDVTVVRDRATIDVRVGVRWSVRLSKDPRRDVHFRITLAHDGGAWRTESIGLRERFRTR
jgi:hypothetical protein